MLEDMRCLRMLEDVMAATDQMVEVVGVSWAQQINESVGRR